MEEARLRQREIQQLRQAAAWGLLAPPSLGSSKKVDLLHVYLCSIQVNFGFYMDWLCFWVNPRLAISYSRYFFCCLQNIPTNNSWQGIKVAMYYDKYCCKKFGWLGGHFTYRQDGEIDHVYWINHGNMVIYGDIWWYMVIHGDIGQTWYGSFWKSDSPKAIVWGERDFTRHRDGIILRNFLATLMGKSCNIDLFEHITYLNQYMDSSPQYIF